MKEVLFRKEAMDNAVSARDIHEPLREEKPGLISWLIAGVVFLVGFAVFCLLWLK